MGSQVGGHQAEIIGVGKVNLEVVAELVTLVGDTFEVIDHGIKHHEENHRAQDTALENASAESEYFCVELICAYCCDKIIIDVVNIGLDLRGEEESFEGELDKGVGNTTKCIRQVNESYMNCFFPVLCILYNFIKSYIMFSDSV